MDEIEKRLREGSEHCFNCYDAWRTNKKDSKATEALQEAIHELRKIASRLEIELAISERDEMAQRPIPIPQHRDSNRRGGAQGDEMPDFGNEDPSYSPPPRNHQGHGGGGSGGGQHRRRFTPRRDGGGVQNKE
jgi:hypothetical protein